MNIQTISTIKMNEDVIENITDIAIFLNESDAMYYIQNEMNKENNNFDYVMLRELPQGVINQTPIKLTIHKYTQDSNTFQQVTANENIIETVSKYYQYKPTEKIVLNLTKEQIQENKSFVKQLKENVDNKNYTEIKNMIDTKERAVSGVLDEIFEQISDGFTKLNDDIDKFFNMFG